jgi:hypothetical protein
VDGWVGGWVGGWVIGDVMRARATPRPPEEHLYAAAATATARSRPPLLPAAVVRIAYVY